MNSQSHLRQFSAWRPKTNKTFTWNKIIFDNLIVAQMIKKFPVLPETRNFTNMSFHLSLCYCLLASLCFACLLAVWSRDFLEKLTASQLVKKFPAFYGSRRFITSFTSARHLSLSWASSIQSAPPHPTSCWNVLLSSHLRLGLPSCLFPSGFPTKIVYTPLHSLLRATCPAHLILLDFITRTIFGEEYRSLRSSLCSFLHSVVTSSLFGPNILLNTIFSNTLSLRSSLSVSDQLSHPYKTSLRVLYHLQTTKLYNNAVCVFWYW